MKQRRRRKRKKNKKKRRKRKKKKRSRLWWCLLPPLECEEWKWTLEEVEEEKECFLPLQTRSPPKKWRRTKGSSFFLFPFFGVVEM